MTRIDADCSVNATLAGEHFCTGTKSGIGLEPFTFRPLDDGVEWRATEAKYALAGMFPSGRRATIRVVRRTAELRIDQNEPSVS